MAFLFYPVAGRTLVEKTYDEFGRESQLTYGNGNTTTYSYDERHQVTSIISTGDENSQTTYKYDAKGNIIEKNGEHNNYKYLYDILGRLTSAYGRGQELSVKYDSFNRTVALTNYINGEGYTTEYTYNNAKGIIEKTRTENSSEESVFEKTYSIDALGRLESYLYSLEGDNNYTVAFEYLEGSGENTTTTLVKKMTVGGVEYEYSYDALGNITEVRKNNEVIQSYVYDSLNQLIRENNAETNQTVVYSYDNHGNILSKTVYPFTLGEIDSEGTTINYGYDSNWTDLLVQFNGQAITYDQIGNPLTYRDGMLFGWSGGRKLSNIAFYDGESYQDSYYNYNDNGIRVYKNANGVITQYYLNGSTIMTEITNNNGTIRRVDYIYDESGSVYGFSVGGEDYYYLKNIQGDITGIIDKNGNLLVSYIYDAYGVPTVLFPGITEDMTDEEANAIISLGNTNPFRYRGYYYDTESGFYYLNSRYYDPVTGRFINGDGLLTDDTLTGNLFAYCGNNPVIYVDSDGRDAIIVLDSDWPPAVGHIGLLIQNEEGEWQHFYWGTSGRLNIIRCFVMFDVPVDKMYESYMGEINLESINKDKNYNGEYEKMLYLKGDFSKSSVYADALKGKYNLYNNNCSQVSFQILAVSNTDNQDIFKRASEELIPNTAYRRVYSEIYANRVVIGDPTAKTGATGYGSQRWL